MRTLHNRPKAKLVIDYCLKTESQDFFDWISREPGMENLTDKRGEVLIANVSPTSVFAAACRAAGIKKVKEDNTAALGCGLVIFDEEAAVAVCEYYLDDNEREDFEVYCTENNIALEDYENEDHVYAQAICALGLGID
jgi:hypothetical protein